MGIAKFHSTVRPYVEGRPVLVLGSAPGPRIPASFTPGGWCLICVNGSGRVAKVLGLPSPDITLSTSGFLTGGNEISAEARRLVEGLETRLLILRFAGSDLFKRLRRLVTLRWRLRGVDYTYDRLLLMTPSIWRPVLREFGYANGSANVSTGVFASILAASLGASRLALAGIDPQSQGHAYNDKNRERQHVTADSKAIGMLRERLDDALLLT